MRQFWKQQQQIPGSPSPQNQPSATSKGFSSQASSPAVHQIMNHFTKSLTTTLTPSCSQAALSSFSGTDPSQGCSGLGSWGFPLLPTAPAASTPLTPSQEHKTDSKTYNTIKIYGIKITGTVNSKGVLLWDMWLGWGVRNRSMLRLNCVLLR